MIVVYNLSRQFQFYFYFLFYTLQASRVPDNYNRPTLLDTQKCVQFIRRVVYYTYLQSHMLCDDAAEDIMILLERG